MSFKLQLYKIDVQALSNLGKTMRNFEKALKKIGPIFRNVVLGDEASHAQRERGGSVNTLVYRVTSVAKSVVGRNVKITLQL